MFSCHNKKKIKNMQSSGIKPLEKFIDYCSVKNKVISKNNFNLEISIMEAEIGF